MKKGNNSDEKLILWCDASNVLSPEELEKIPWTEEQDKKLESIVEEIGAKFGLVPEPSEKPVSIFAVAKYILKKQGKLSTLELQKLCYYSQAWHYTWTEKRLIKEEFQAWRNGPVCPKLFYEHRGKFMIAADEIGGDDEELSADAKDSIDIVLEHYGNLSGDELRDLTHSESPWKDARGDLPDDAQCTNEITLESMGKYYRKHLI